MDTIIVLLDTIIVLLNVFVGIIISTLVIAVAILIAPFLPYVAEALSNKPNRYQENLMETTYKVSTFGFFTKLIPGQVKIIETKGGSFVRCIMRYEGHTFAGLVQNEIPINTSDFWRITETSKNGVQCRDADPTMPLWKIGNEGSLFRNFISWWSSKVYSWTGFVFVGIYPYRQVRTYKMARQEEMPGGATIHKSDYSDHLRVADFEFPVVVKEADTSDMTQVMFEIKVIGRTFNPYLAAYATDDWATRLRAATIDRVTGYTRLHELKDVLAAKRSDTAGNKLALNIMEIGTLLPKKPKGRGATSEEKPLPIDTIVPFGIMITQVLITEIAPVESTSLTKKRLADVAYARVDSAAAAERAKGTAASLREQIAAVKEGGDVGLAVLAAEQSVRTAGAADKNAIVIVGGSGGDVNPIQAAMLRSLRDKELQNKLSGEN